MLKTWDERLLIIFLRQISCHILLIKQEYNIYKTKHLTGSFFSFMLSLVSISEFICIQWKIDSTLHLTVHRYKNLVFGYGLKLPALMHVQCPFSIEMKIAHYFFQELPRKFPVWFPPKWLSYYFDISSKHRISEAMVEFLVEASHANLHSKHTAYIRLNSAKYAAHRCNEATFGQKQKLYKDFENWN